MKKIHIRIGVLALIIVGISFLIKNQDSTNTENLATEHPGWFDHYLELKGDENGKIPSGLLASWYKTDKANGRLAFKKAENNITTFKEVGPFNVAGRTRSIVIDHSNKNHIITAGISGGIWVSENNGESWAAVNDTAPTLSASCIDQSPFDKNVFYYGTGEPLGNSADIGGLGIFKSTDGAKSFDHLEHTVTAAFDEVWDIKHSLTKDSTIYVATDQDGLWRSTDAGASFTKVYNSSRRIQEIKVFKDSTLMISVNGYGIIKFDEETFTGTRLNNNWPSSNFSRITFDYCDSFPKVLFAHIVNAQGNSLVKSLKSSDGGKTWQTLRAPSIGSYTYAWYCFKLSVSPVDTNLILSLSVKPNYSLDGGKTWRNMGHPHSDYHEVTWYNGQELLTGSDGGIHRFNTSNLSTYTTLNNGLNITQFYAGHHAPSGSTLIAGSQDNGTRYSVNSNQYFSRVYGGDGSYCAINQQDPDVRYVSWQNLNMYRQENGLSRNISTYIKAAIGGDDFVWFINPYTMNDLEGNQLYVPTKKETYRSLDGGYTWDKLTGNLLGDSYCVGLSNDKNPTAYVGGTASRLYRIDSAATAQEGQEIDMFNTKVPNFLSSTIGCIEVDPNNAGTIYCGLVNISTRSRIWRVRNANTDNPQWDDLSNNLPRSMPVNWIEVDPQNSDHLIIATDYGLYTSLNGGLSWNKEHRMPNVPIDKLSLRSSDRKLFLYTHGRGAWTADLTDNPVSKVAAVKQNKLNIYPNPASNYIINQTEAEITLYNNRGAVVLKSAEPRIDISKIAAGIYFAENIKDGVQYTAKLVVTH